MAKKERLDKILVDLGYFDTKSKASSAIIAGDVKINDEKITKAGFQINPEKELNIEIKSMPYVSRGGFKIQKAYETFGFEIQNRICLDAGASTGGFTDFLLQKGAKKVYAVDVGYGQLAWKLRNDDRVKVIERTNIRTCTFEDIYGALPSPLAGEESFSRRETSIRKTGEGLVADLLVADLSFISITKVLENLKNLLTEEHEMVMLIKPQFEAGKGLVDKGGVVKDKNVHIDVINNVANFAQSLGYKILGLTYSSIKGPSGNIEYLIWLSNKIEDGAKNSSEFFAPIETIVEKAFEKLNT